MGKGQTRIRIEKDKQGKIVYITINSDAILRELKEQGINISECDGMGYQHLHLHNIGITIYPSELTQEWRL